MPGGMWSGWAGSRTFQPTTVASQHIIGVYQGGHRPRWSNGTARQEKTRRDHRGWSTHITTSRGKRAKPNPAPNGIFVTSGEIGTHAMHPPGKRINNNKVQPIRNETRGRTQRSAPTRRICPMVRDSKFGNRNFDPPGERSIDINKWQRHSDATGGRGGPPLRGDS